MKIVMIFLVMVVLPLHILFAQIHVDYLNFRSYNESLLLSISDSKVKKTYWKEYGELYANTSKEKYLCQSQEYDASLNLYLFPKRIYSPGAKRFFQPDPLSQYFSPYLFVGADPINFIDEDGRAAKPVVLYGLQSRPETDDLMVPFTVDLQKEMDAYYIPIADFVNHKYEMPKEWNGNVFIDAHGNEDGEIASEMYERGEKVRTGKYAAKMEDDEGMLNVTVDNRALGGEIARMSRKTGVPLKNITLSSCQGSQAAEEIGSEVTRLNHMYLLPTDFSSKGLCEGNLGITMSNTENREYDLLAGKPLPTEDIPLHFFVEDEFLREDGYDFVKSKDGHGFDLRNTKIRKKTRGIKGKQGIEDFVNGRLPDNMSHYFDEYSFEFPKP